MELNNIACRDRAHGIAYSQFGQCNPQVGEPDCIVKAPRPFQFSTGRKDCVPNTSDKRVDAPYKTYREEAHPDAGGNGTDTLNYMKQRFSFNVRESVAIMGAHTLGALHIRVSHHKYVWLAMSGTLWNNGYYRNMASKADWFYPVTDALPNGTSFTANMVASNCKGLGDINGARPAARWRVNANAELPPDPQWPPCAGDPGNIKYRLNGCRGGPVQWIQEKLVCPCFDGRNKWWRSNASDFDGKGPMCRPGDVESCKPGSMQWAFVKGVDETMLNSDFGLYRNFSVINGMPIDGGACPGLKVGLDWKEQARADQCPLNTIRDPPSDKPSYRIVEEYADSNAAWLNDFFPTFEKMLSNGYSASALSSMPMPATSCLNVRPYSCALTTPAPATAAPVSPAPAAPASTCGGTGGGASCSFPFTYKGMQYTSCTTTDSPSEPWCMTSASQYGFCNCAF